MPPKNMRWIPGGEFTMGSDEYYPEEQPVHRARTAGFWMDEHPVTVAEFRRFVKATGHRTTAEAAPSAEEFPDADPAQLVCQVGSTRLTYDARVVEDLHVWLREQGDWVFLGSADEQKPAREGTVEAWARSADNPIGGWYGLRKGYRGRVGMYLPPLLEELGLAEVEHLRVLEAVERLRPVASAAVGSLFQVAISAALERRFGRQLDRIESHRRA